MLGYNGLFLIKTFLLFKPYSFKVMFCFIVLQLVEVSHHVLALLADQLGAGPEGATRPLRYGARADAGKRLDKTSQEKTQIRTQRVLAAVR